MGTTTAVPARCIVPGANSPIPAPVGATMPKVSDALLRDNQKWDGVWRDPDDESVDLYPGLVVHDGRVTGSITVSRSRLPLWAFAGWMVKEGWDEVVKGWDYIETEYDWDADKMGMFLYYLLEQRGEFGRLLLLLADAERCEHESGRWNRPWWRTKRHKKRVGDQLRRCLAALENA